MPRALLRARFVGIVALVVVVPIPGSAQVLGGFDTSVHSAYVWRGLTRRNAWVSQTDVMAAYRRGPVTVTAGGWVNVELTKADPRIDEALGYGRRFGEVNAWFETAVAAEQWDFAAGLVTYQFTGEVRAATVGNLVSDFEEVYARVGGHFRIGRLGALSASGAVWHALRTVDGTYGEVEANYNLPLFPLVFPAVRVGGRAGINFDHDGTPPVSFTDTGITHVETFLEVQVSLPIAGLNFYALPAVHVQRNLDPATRLLDRLGGGSDVKGWVSVSMSLYGGR